jgi:tetratricopeptide (TPR) repeat protein
VARSGARDVAASIELHRACAAEFERLAEAGVDPPGSRLRRAEHIGWVAFDLVVQSHDFAEALAVADDAIAAFEACLTEQPGSIRARRGLFEARFRRATANRRLGQWADALARLDDLVIQAPSVYGPEASADRKLQLTLRDLHRERAAALLTLSRYADAAAAYDEALRRDDGTEWADLTIQRAVLNARSGRAVEALETFRAQLSNPHLSAWNVFNVACGYAQASVATDLPDSARAASADAAVATLRRALAADAFVRGAISRDADLRPLYGRPDFQALLVDK